MPREPHAIASDIRDRAVADLPATTTQDALATDIERRERNALVFVAHEHDGPHSLTQRRGCRIRDHQRRLARRRRTKRRLVIERIAIEDGVGAAHRRRRGRLREDCAPRRRRAAPEGRLDERRHGGRIQDCDDEHRNGDEGREDEPEDAHAQSRSEPRATGESVKRAAQRRAPKARHATSRRAGGRGGSRREGRCPDKMTRRGRRDCQAVRAGEVR